MNEEAHHAQAHHAVIQGTAQLRITVGSGSKGGSNYLRESGRIRRSAVNGERGARSHRSRSNARNLRDPIVLRMASPGFLLI